MRTLQCFQKYFQGQIFFNFLYPWKHKKMSSKAHNRPKIIFFSTGPAAQMAQKQKSRTTKSRLMQDWVFRLGYSPFVTWQSLDCLLTTCLSTSSCSRIYWMTPCRTGVRWYDRKLKFWASAIFKLQMFSYVFHRWWLNVEHGGKWLSNNVFRSPCIYVDK